MEQPDIDGLNIEDEVDMEFNIPESGESEIDLSLFLVGRFWLIDVFTAPSWRNKWLKYGDL